MTLRDTQANPAYLPIGEAARQLGVSADTLRRWEREGRIEAIRTLGNQRRYRQSDIDALTSPSSAMPSPDGLPPAGEGVSSFTTVPQQWTGEPQAETDGPIRAALTDIATRFPLVPVELADAMDEHGGDAIAFAWISPTGVLLRLELLSEVAAS